MASQRALLCALVVAAGFAVLRPLWLDADPPGYILDEFITDEGWYAQAARNHALFGRWVMDEHNVPLVLCPAHTLALRSSYAAFGVSFWSTRIVGALASALTVFAVAWGLRQLPLAAGIAAVIVATQPILFSLARVAYCESLQLLLVTAAWMSASDSRRRPATWAAAGAASGLAVLAKASALYAPALALLAPFLTGRGGDTRRTVRETAFVAAGLALVAAVALPFVLPFADVLVVESGREGSVLEQGGRPPAGLALPLMLGLHFTTGVLPGFWVGLLPMLAVSGLAGARLLTFANREAGLPAPARLAIAWLVLSLGFLCLRAAPATQERYWANLLVPLACLIAVACAQPLEARPALNAGRRWLAMALLALGPALLARQAALELLTQASGEAAASLVRVRFMSPIMLLALGAFALLLSRGEWAWHIARARAVQVAALAAVVVGVSAILFSMSRPTYTIRDTSRGLRAGEPKVMTGDLANTLALETPFWAFVCRDLALSQLGKSGWVNGDWRALGATHWLNDRPPGQDGWRTPAPREAVLESSHSLWPDAAGRPRLTAYISRLH